MSQLSPAQQPQQAQAAAAAAASATTNSSHLLPTVFTGWTSGAGINASGGGDDDDPTTVACQGIHCYPDAFFYAATGVTVFLALAGAFSNILTIVAILTSNLRNNINSILICHLSFSGAAYCTLLLPLQATAFYYKDWVAGDFLCELHASLRIWLIGANMCLLSCIAFYRFLNVVHPQVHTCLSLRPWFIVAVAICWALPVAFAFTPIVNWWGTYCFNRGILQCTFAGHGSLSHKITSITLGYVVPCTFICVCYSRIGCVVFSSRKRSSRGSVYRRQRAKRESFRLTAMMVLIFLGFLCGTTPFFLLNLLDKDLTLAAAHVWFPVLAWVMYSLTPVIYTVMDANFQAAYRRLLLCEVKRAGPHKLGETSGVDRQSSPLTSIKRRPAE